MRALKLAGMGLGLVLLLSSVAAALPLLEADNRTERLATAVNAKDHAAVAALLAQGANPNTGVASWTCGMVRNPSVYYNTLLGSAVVNGDGVTARLLLKHGAAPFVAHHQEKWVVRLDLIEMAKGLGDPELAALLQTAKKTAAEAPRPDYPRINPWARSRQSRMLVYLGIPASGALWGGWWLVVGSVGCLAQTTRQLGKEQLGRGLVWVAGALLLGLFLYPNI